MFLFYFIGFIVIILFGGLLLDLMERLGCSPIQTPKYDNQATTPEYKTPTEDVALGDGQDYYVGWKTIGLTARAGYEKMDMVGMKHRALGPNDLGKFEGYAEAEDDNEHDPYAIAIYREDYTHVGFLERGNSFLHDYISEQGGVVHCYGYIACGGFDEIGYPKNYYAEVCVETDAEEVKKRNKPYKTDDKFYDYEEGELQRMLEASQQ